jgi:hypothetical protein
MTQAGYNLVTEELAKVDDLPVEINQIRDVIINNGFQDEIIITGQPAEPRVIRGMFYQYTTREYVYSLPTLCTMIIYNTNLPLEWQRLAAAKELVHIFDRSAEKTNDPDEVMGMIDRLLGPMATDDATQQNLMALTDQIALYKCLPWLIPAAAREKCCELIAQGVTTAERVADVPDGADFEIYSSGMLDDCVR